jgi:hypothetical protein
MVADFLKHILLVLHIQSSVDSFFNIFLIDIYIG